MPTITEARTIDVTPERVWALVSDPHHLPRWWPRVARVEAVYDSAFTEVLESERGRRVRADFVLVEQDEDQMRLVWAQQVEGTPFARVLKSAETELRLQTLDGSGPPRTEVTISLRQRLRGPLANLGSVLVRRAASKTLKDALNGLERIAA